MRRKTISVNIGNLVLSSDHPVMIQSMLNAPTLDTEACVEQAIRIIEAGGQLVRITAQGVREAENLKAIHEALRSRGYDTPISADIHFNPDAALVAARYVEKVRINPGNFIDKRAVFVQVNYTDEEYEAELLRLKTRFSEFLDVCRQHGTAVRIGTNHGSLSDRIMSRYGNTPSGMVEATMEYLRVCRDEKFDDVVISLKSSDCRVMVDAVRLLVAAMASEDMKYPLHLGVTEAGEGEDGRIRSAVGIGTLLNEGIGDTVRVSLTEAPETEIPVARALTEICCRPDFRAGHDALKGDCSRPLVVADLSRREVIDERVTRELGFGIGRANDPVTGDNLCSTLISPEIIYTETLGPELTKLPEEVTVLVPLPLIDMAHVYNRMAAPLCSVDEYVGGTSVPGENPVFVQVVSPDEWNPVLAARLKGDPEAVIVLSSGPDYWFFRDAFDWLGTNRVGNRVIIRTAFGGTDWEKIGLTIASQTGGFFLDRLAWGLWVALPEIADEARVSGLGRSILQSAGTRRYKAEFISCPGCGRTLFDLQGAVALVKEKFGHLSALKIAVMGCVVNGPGEMGDADYGYVGAGNGKVNLYRAGKMVKAAVPESEAMAQLKELIMVHGDWMEPQS